MSWVLGGRPLLYLFDLLFVFGVVDLCLFVVFLAFRF
jgi:hypothetical protein